MANTDIKTRSCLICFSLSPLDKPLNNWVWEICWYLLSYPYIYYWSIVFISVGDCCFTWCNFITFSFHLASIASFQDFPEYKPCMSCCGSLCMVMPLQNCWIHLVKWPETWVKALRRMMSGWSTWDPWPRCMMEMDSLFRAGFVSLTCWGWCLCLYFAGQSITQRR